MKQTETTSGKKKIDWSEVHRRTEAVTAALEKGIAPVEKRKLLKARAKALAQETKTTESVQEYLEVVDFLLAGERYGIEASFVREIYPLKELVTVPCTPPFVLGITNVRGQIVSVIDIKKFFELPDKGLTELDKVIIVQNSEMELGIHADAVVGMRSIPLEEIQPSLLRLTGIRERYLKGVTKEMVVILDIEKLMSDKSIVVHEEI